MSRALPSSRGDGAPYRIAVVCLGNICRSPMADVVLNARLERAGLADAVHVVSAGTGGWHVGGPMDDRAAALLADRGYDATRHRAQRFDPAWLDDMDLVLAMDRDNLSFLRRMAPEGVEVRLFRSFDPDAPDGAEVPDPYYGEADCFEEVLRLVEAASDGVAKHIADEID